MVFEGDDIDQATTLNGDVNIALIRDCLQISTFKQIRLTIQVDSGRLRWRCPGSDLYLVYQDLLNVDYGSQGEVVGRESEERSVTLKLTYWYDTTL